MNKSLSSVGFHVFVITPSCCLVFIGRDRKVVLAFLRTEIEQIFYTENFRLSGEKHVINFLQPR